MSGWRRRRVRFSWAVVVSAMARRSASFFMDVRDSTSQPLHSEIDQLLFQLRVWRIHQLNAAEGQRLFEHAARVGKRLKSETAVRFSDVALADAAEWKIQMIEVNQCVVDGGAAGAGLAQSTFLHLAIDAAQIQPERLLACGDRLQCFAEVAIGLHREERAEDLLLHELR